MWCFLFHKINMLPGKLQVGPKAGYERGGWSSVTPKPAIASYLTCKWSKFRKAFCSTFLIIPVTISIKAQNHVCFSFGELSHPCQNLSLYSKHPFSLVLVANSNFSFHLDSALLNRASISFLEKCLLSQKRVKRDWFKLLKYSSSTYEIWFPS